MTEDQLAQLRVYLAEDPDSLGLADLLFHAEDPRVADMLNEVRPTVSVPRGEVGNTDILARIAPADHVGLDALGLARLSSVLTVTQADVASYRTLLAAVFPGDTATYAALAEYAARPGSIAERDFGPGFTVSAADVGAAR